MVGCGVMWACERQADPSMPARPPEYYRLPAEERAWWLEGYLSVERPKCKPSKFGTLEAMVVAFCVGYMAGLLVLSH